MADPKIDNNKKNQIGHVLVSLLRKILPNFVEESQKDERHQFFLLYNRPFTIQ